MITPYVIVELEQGTPEWLAWRHNGIGASEASTIMGENPFESADRLLQRKCNPPVGGRVNRAMAIGAALEPKVRSYYNNLLSRQAEPKCIQSLKYEWLRASLDGLTPDGAHALEIKCGKSAYAITRKLRRPPSHYYAQLQHILAATGLQSVDYCCYFPKSRPILLNIKRDEEYIHQLLEAEEKFWKLLINSRAN